MSILNDIGVGLLGFTGAYNAGQDRALRERMFELQSRGLDRQEALARSQIELEQQKLAQFRREHDMQENFYTNMPGYGQGGQTQPPQVNQQVTPQVNPANLSQGNRDLTDYWGRWYGLTPDQQAVLPRIMSAESGGNQWAHRRENNGSDSFGPMQINSVNLGMLGPGENIFDPSVNTRIGTEIFKRNLDQFGGDTTKALWGYNAGPERVKQGVMPASTRQYIDKITSPTPPGTNYAAAPTNTATDAGGTAPQAPQQQGAPKVDPNMVAYMLKGTMSQSKQVRDASTAWISNNKAAVDIFNATNPGFVEGVKSQYAIQTKRGELQAQNEIQGPDYQGDVERSKGQAQMDVKDATDAIDTAKAAQGTLNNILFAKSLDVPTGALEPTKAALGAVLYAVGIDPKSVGLQDINNIGKMQAFQATANNLILNAAGNMKGTLSDKDVAFLKQTVASLGNTPQANRMLLDFAERVARRQVERGQFYRSHVDKTGSVKGAGKAWDEYIQGQDMFADLASTTQGQMGAGDGPAAAPPPPGGAVILKRKGM